MSSDHISNAKFCLNCSTYHWLSLINKLLQKTNITFIDFIEKLAHLSTQPFKFISILQVDHKIKVWRKKSGRLWVYLSYSQFFHWKWNKICWFTEPSIEILRAGETVLFSKREILLRESWNGFNYQLLMLQENFKDCIVIDDIIFKYHRSIKIIIFDFQRLKTSINFKGLWKFIKSFRLIDRLQVHEIDEFQWLTSSNFVQITQIFL